MTRKDYQYFANVLGTFEYYLETNQDVKNEFNNLKDNIRHYFIKDNRRFDYDKFDKAMNKSFFDTKLAQTLLLIVKNLTLTNQNANFD